MADYKKKELRTVKPTGTNAYGVAKSKGKEKELHSGAVKACGQATGVQCLNCLSLRDQ